MNIKRIMSHDLSIGAVSPKMTTLPLLLWKFLMMEHHRVVGACFRRGIQSTEITNILRLTTVIVLGSISGMTPDSKGMLGLDADDCLSE
jgi:hypothetical protein